MCYPGWKGRVGAVLCSKLFIVIECCSGIKCGLQMALVTFACFLSIYHCKNKLVVSTTEWLPWLQTIGDTVTLRGLFWYLRLIAKGNSRAAAQFILQPQYTENLYNICGSLTWLQVPYCNFEVHL